jgi:general transcription factor 3C polypeptide 5 (transcription factor C subunit 1)
MYGCVIIKPDAQSVPTGPKWDLPPEDSLTPYLQSLIANIRDELQSRPIVTRHYLFNKLGWDKRDRLREAAIYCGYFFETGPWREAIITWGLDPRKDPSFRQYQTISFLSYKATGTAKRFAVFDENVRKFARMSADELKTQHIFDGVHVSETGNLFQFCDVTDPIIRTILDTKDIRPTCAVSNALVV